MLRENSINIIGGEGNMYSTEFRMFDARLGRWLSLDPLMDQFPWMSPFVGMDNNPISLIDPLGLSTGDDKAKELGLPGDPKDGKVYKANNGNKYLYKDGHFRRQLDKITIKQKWWQKIKKIVKKVNVKIQKALRIINAIKDKTVNWVRRVDSRAQNGIEQKSRTGIPWLDKMLNNGDGITITNTDGDEGGSTGRYTDKKGIPFENLNDLLAYPRFGKSYKPYSYNPTTQKPRNANDPDVEGMENKEDYEENAEIAESVAEGFEKDDESKSNTKPTIKKKTDNMVQLRIYKTYYISADSSITNVLFEKSVTVRKSDLKLKYGSYYIDKNGDYGITIK